jgi:hypothetical protein
MERALFFLDFEDILVVIPPWQGYGTSIAWEECAPEPAMVLYTLISTYLSKGVSHAHHREN